MIDIDIKPTSQILPEIDSANHQPASSQVHDQDVLFAAKGGSLTFAGKLFEYAVRFAFSVVIARVIGAEQFGLYTLGLTVAMLASTMALLGLQTGMVRFLPPAIRRGDDASVWGIIQTCAIFPAVLSLSFSILIFLLADLLATQIFKDPRLGNVIRLVSFSIPLDSLASIAYVIIISFKRPEFSVLANNVILPVVKFLLSVGFLALGLGTLGIISAHVISTAIGLATIVYFVNSLFSLVRPWSSARRSTGQLIRYSLPVHLGWMVNTVRGTLETLILGFLGLTTGVGVYAAALRLSAIGSMLYLSIGNISTPIIADLYSRGESTQMKAYYQTTTRWLVMFNLPLFLTFVIFAGPLLAIFGASFSTGAAGLMILAAGTLVYTCTGIGANILDMTDHTKLNSANSVFLVFITIGLDVLLIPRWGVVGAAGASALSTILVNFVCWGEVFFLLHMQPYNRLLIKPVVAGFTTLLASYLLLHYTSFAPFFQLILGAPLLWGVYLLVLWQLGLPVEDLMVLKRFKSRLKFRNLIHGNLVHYKSS